MASKPRTAAAMVEPMSKNQQHAWSLEELRAALRRRRHLADFSSVFRAAEKLTAGGAIRKLILDDGPTRFELVGAHHDHLYCMRCHELVSVPCLIEHERFAAVERATGAAILDHHVLLRGLCRDCRSADEARGRT